MVCRGMARAHVLLLVLLAGAEAGVPSCNTLRRNCVYSAGIPFGDAWEKVFGEMASSPMRPSALASKLTQKEHDAMCDPSAWRIRDACYSNCPLAYVLTHPPRLSGMRVCLADNKFTPQSLEGHLDGSHPLMGKELELEIVGEKGKESRSGCEAQHFKDGKNYTGKLVVVDRGGCYFYQKFEAANTAGPAVAIMMNRNLFRYDAAFYTTSMTGMQSYFQNLPTAMMGKYDADILEYVYDAGERVAGRLQFNCNDRTSTSPDYVTDNCPSGLLEGNCLDRESPEERLCGKCMLEYELNGTRCLFGNDLQPRRAANYLWGGRSPGAVVTETIYYVEGGGCNPSDYAGLAGEVVLVDHNKDCHTLMVHHAAVAKVKALLVGDATKDAFLWLMAGPSVFGVAVHTVHPKDMATLTQWVKSGVAVRSRVFRSPTAMSFREGALHQPPPTTPAPTLPPHTPEAVLDERADFEWSPTVVVCCVLIVVLTVAIVVKFVHQRQNSVDLPGQGEEGITMPLSAASMGLSLTLLLLIAVVGFVLAYDAGQSSTNTALDDGRRAVQKMYSNAVENVEELADALMGSLRQSTKNTIQELENEAVALLRVIRSLFVHMDSSWDSFNRHYDTFVEIDRGSSWNIMIRTSNHFFMADIYKTDDRVPDNGLPPVNVTNNGLLYDIIKYKYESKLRKNTFHTTYLQDEFQPFTRVGGTPMNPYTFAETRTDPDHWYVPYITRYSVPRDYGATHPISFLCTLPNATKANLGVAEVQVSLSYLSSLITSRISAGPAENATVVVFDADGNIVTTTSGPYRREVDQYFQVSYDEATELLKVHQTFTAEVNALGGYIQRSFGGYDKVPEKHFGAFEQSAEYTHPDSELLRIGFDSGVKDETPNNWHLSHGGRVVPTGRRHGDSAMVFDGTEPLYVFANLTTEIRRVRDTQIPTANGSWASSFQPYAFARPLPDGTPAIHTYNPSSGTWHPVNRESWHQSPNTISMWVNPAESVTGEALLTTPELFQSSQEIDAPISVLANGQLIISRSDQSCSTNPISGGLPVGVWTYLVAVTDFYAGECSVYVNGTLHSTGLMKRSPVPTYYGTGYRIGNRFKGMIDDIEIRNTSMTSGEVHDRYTAKPYRKQVPQMKWMLQVSNVDLASGPATVPLYVAVMVPEEDVLRQVEINNKNTERLLEVQEANTRKRMTHMTNETLFILVVIALFSVLLFLVFNELLTRPFATFACRMTDVAVMKVDDIGTEWSFISEMNAMHRAMALMVGNLKEYKSYMPQTLLAINESSDEDDDIEHLLSDVGTTRRRSREMSDVMSEDQRSWHSRQSRTTPTSQSGRTRTSGGRASQDLVTQNVHHARGKKAGMILSLSKKKATFAVVNFVNWHGIFLSDSDSEMVTVHGSCLSALLLVFSACKGVPDQFTGDRIMCSFNACKPVATHRTSACRALLMATKKIHELASSRPLAISSGCASGDARVGNMGTEGMKKFSYISPVVTWTFALERLCRTLELSNLVDFHVAEDATAEFLLRHIDTVHFPKRHATRPIRVSQLVNVKDSKDMEWMYQMDEGEKSDPFSSWNDMCRAMFAGDWAEAERHAEHITIDHSGPILDRILKSIERKQYTPHTIQYH
eukprot:Sspe_Gene.7924::Locus_2685_Transcript_5_5_Confidence_0.333_Length_5209::g.7924::m.7924